MVVLSPQKERTERLVISPLNQLLSMFTGPHKLVQKRFDKLLDFYNCTERAEKLKDKKTLEELQSARNNYEALNAQLLDELPKFHQYARGLLTNCVHGYAQAHCDFVRRALEQLQPLLSVREPPTIPSASRPPTSGLGEGSQALPVSWECTCGVPEKVFPLEILKRALGQARPTWKFLALACVWGFQAALSTLQSCGVVESHRPGLLAGPRDPHRQAWVLHPWSLSLSLSQSLSLSLPHPPTPVN